MYRLSLVVVGLLVTQSLLLAQKKPDLTSLLEARTFKQDKGTLSYRLLKPEGYDAKKSYPLVIFLHGAGERGDDNKAQLRHGVIDFAKESSRKKFPCFLIAPQCPTGRSWSAGLRLGKAKPKPNQGEEPGKLVLDLIDSLSKEFSIDKNRIYLTGLSMGGYGTWDLLSKRPELFAAGIPICGGGNEKNAEKLVKIPLWVFHGDKDTAVPVSRSRNMVEAIKKAGGSPKYTEYPGVGHDSWTRTYRNEEVLTWLFEQKKK